MAKSRARSKELLEAAGLTTKDFQGTWHRARDFNAADLKREIAYIKEHGKPSIQKAPSDVPKAIRERYRETFEPKKKIRIKEPAKPPRVIGGTLEPPEPPKKYPPPELPDGKIIVFWQDITKRKGKSRYPRAFEEIIKNKKIMRQQDLEAILKFIFGEKGNKDNEGHIKIDKGKIGDVDIRVYSSEAELKLIKKEYRGWKILYNGKGKSRKDLLIGFAATVSGVYNSRLTRDAAGYFIDQVKKIHPANGEWLDELYRKYAEKGFE